MMIVTYQVLDRKDHYDGHDEYIFVHGGCAWRVRNTGFGIHHCDTRPSVTFLNAVITLARLGLLDEWCGGICDQWLPTTPPTKLTNEIDAIMQVAPRVRLEDLIVGAQT